LDFAPDGNLYVSDMVGGAVLKYKPTGGGPIAALGGQTGGFNNVAGIAIDRDGTLYAADNGLGQIQQIDPGGRFVRKFDLGCKPIEMALNGDWIEVACGERGLVSLNKRTGAVQQSRVAGDSPPIANLTGLTLGPDGLLYVIDRSTIIAYKVQH
jgi:streptogramin lyase